METRRAVQGVLQVEITTQFTRHSDLHTTTQALSMVNCAMIKNKHNKKHHSYCNIISSGEITIETNTKKIQKGQNFSFNCQCFQIN
jgi:hypothetical protein